MYVKKNIFSQYKKACEKVTKGQFLFITCRPTHVTLLKVNSYLDFFLVLDPNLVAVSVSKMSVCANHESIFQ